jgi:hypothetical protein
MKRFLTRASVAGLSAALVAGAALVAAPAASAAPIGSLTFTSGVNDGVFNSQDDTFSFQTDGACPTSPTNSTNFLIRVSGPGLPAAPNLVNIQGNTAGSTVGSITSGPFTGPVQQTLSGFATAQAQAGGYLGAGVYTLELVCRTALQSASLGEFVGQIQITGSGASSVVSPVLASVATATTLAGPATGDSTTTASFTASVSPTNAVGQVQFKRGGVSIGAPVTPALVGGVLSATSPAVGPLAPGSYAITAEFVGGSSASSSFQNSTSNTIQYVVSQASAATATTLGLSSASVQAPATVTATATVTSGGNPVAGGAVQFKVNGVNAGLPVTVAGGTAVSAPISRGPGAGYSVTAEYTGFTAAGVQYGDSVSAPALFDVTASAYAPDEQNIETVIPAGTLTISTPYTPSAPLELPAMVLNPSATEYSTSAAFEPIVVTDTRPGNLPWTLSAISSDLVKDGVAAPGVNETIDGQNVGLVTVGLPSSNVTPLTITTGLPAGSADSAVTNLSTFDNPSAPHVAAGAAGTLGLGGTAKKVVHANSGLGTSTFAGTLTITAPTNTLDGTYKGTVTFTIIGS